MVDESDWRLQGQERYLQARLLTWRSWSPVRAGWDHDHCELCWVHFSNHQLADDPDTQLAGYTTADDCWICAKCFGDFQQRFFWTIASD